MGRRQAMGGASKAVAIKLLASHLATKSAYRRMFVDEARLTMMLTHSNIVQVFDVGEHGGRSYLVMEWIDGLDLSRLAASLRERGINPYPDRFDRTHTLAEARALGDSQNIEAGQDAAEDAEVVQVAGRLIAFRAFGRACLEKLAEECSGLDPGAPVDPRYISCLMVSEA